MKKHLGNKFSFPFTKNGLEKAQVTDLLIGEAYLHTCPDTHQHHERFFFHWYWVWGVEVFGTQLSSTKCYVNAMKLPLITENLGYGI